jgi:hypothetical protein
MKIKKGVVEFVTRAGGAAFRGSAWAIRRAASPSPQITSGRVVLSVSPTHFGTALEVMRKLPRRRPPLSWPRSDTGPAGWADLRMPFPGP